MSTGEHEVEGRTVTLHFSDAELKVLREKYRKLSDDEFSAFMAACQRYLLNPLANQIYARLQEKTDRNPRSVTYCAQIDGYRLIADRTQQYAGNDDPTYDNDTKPTKATVTVHKLVGGQRCGFTATARWEQYFPGERQGFMWKKMPHLMLGKCAEALALRKAFPAELSGLYTLEEMQQADSETEAGDKKTTQENPFRKQAEERKPAAKPKTFNEAVRQCQTPAELADLLKRRMADHPVGSDVITWQKILKGVMAECNARMADGAWQDAEQVQVVIQSIDDQISTVEQGEEAFSGASA